MRYRQMFHPLNEGKLPNPKGEMFEFERAGTKIRVKLTPMEARRYASLLV